MDNIDLVNSDKSIRFTADGIEMSPLAYSQLLYKLTKSRNIERDVYSLGGIISEFEAKFADLLGKETAVMMPSGTLSNQIAIRELANNKGRVLVQKESHIYNDSGDCLQTLSRLNLIPLAPDRATFTLDDVKQVIDKAKTGKVVTEVGVISIESPVRRKYNEIFNFEEMKKISTFAKDQGIRLHLDGARLFIASTFSGISPKEYASLFDTVYVSLFKYFNAGFGAILACSNEFAKDLYHVRRMFGGNIFQMWPSAVIALNFLDTFMDELRMAIKLADDFFDLIHKNSSFKVEKIPNGSNVFKLHVSDVDLDKFRDTLEKKNVYLPEPEPDSNTFLLRINVTLNRISADRLAQIFIESLHA
ncbi:MULTISPECIES: low specificity L-threonine aldolase [Okeania]|uniref:Amino acid lyase n=1 Tax=Okeania hirsuta TaxID=1458930 RepID=A0A3N6MWI2_9CYAN|nr:MULTISPECIES: aminotransferase class I/II-fold pyridoxal phosphate-dependent enzyme [Okeania]NES76180.1 amino acid lyase [Okeania sp. SIO1H4]NES87786.1 amino acid lyase [Okeania sp. SIO2B9]NET19383.1 amino acid lyase [Okeania sp. SIO1H5]NET76544.1 amino acid lyase [Okeania sp. SIO1F9]NET93266.1 amino acid lyase [Okeania sp. SIO1H2]